MRASARSIEIELRNVITGEDSQSKEFSSFRERRSSQTNLFKKIEELEFRNQALQTHCEEQEEQTLNMERRLELLIDDNTRLEMVLKSVDETGVEEEVKKARVRAETKADKRVESLMEQMKKKLDDAEHIAFKAEMKVKILEDEKRICQTENLELKDRIREFELNYVPKQRLVYI